MLKKIKRNKKGFTLTELIVVIAILGVLAAVVTPSVIGYLSDAKTSADAANLATIDSCVKRLAAKGTIDLTATWPGDKANVLTAIQTEIQTLPTPADTTNTKWVINKTADDKTVWVTQEAPGADSTTRMELN